MTYPTILKLNSEQEYKDHWKQHYCQGEICTFDGIQVRFKIRDFDHAFFESIHKKDDTFSLKRAERIDWIKAALKDQSSEKFVGYDSTKKRYDPTRRVTIVMGNYVVIIALKKNNTANFISAFVADTPGRKGRPSTIEKIRSGQKWT